MKKLFVVTLAVLLLSLVLVSGSGSEGVAGVFIDPAKNPTLHQLWGTESCVFPVTLNLFNY